jgi:steroid delta-isomerase-like uncharacterized protein
MSASENAVRVRMGMETIWNQGHWAATAELFSPNVEMHGFPSPEPFGLEGLRALFELLRGAFPDLHMTIEHLLGEGDMIALHWTATGTHLGEFRGFPPTGKRVRLRELAHFRFEEGRVREAWFAPDSLGLMIQLGFRPPPPGLLKVVRALERLGLIRPRPMSTQPAGGSARGT